jgi:hypothetical protein
MQQQKIIFWLYMMLYVLNGYHHIIAAFLTSLERNFNRHLHHLPPHRRPLPPRLTLLLRVLSGVAAMALVLVSMKGISVVSEMTYLFLISLGF